MIEQIKKMRERIMTHQETNGFETIYDFLNEDLDELEKLAKDSGDIHSVSERVFCFLYSDGDEIYSKSAIAETRTEARKIIEDKYPKLFLLRNDSSYENVR